tara:strand:- start:13942 stop:14430 length:489 start_codon:yes stop_codon:yes gene_type:complete
MNFCRDWIFDVAVAKVSDEFLSLNLPLNTLAKKYAEGLSEKYAEISVQEVSDSSELLLLFLNEVDAGESAVEFLNGFQYFRYNFESVNKLRKLTPLFGAADDPTKTMTYSGEATAKRFKAYVFGLRSNSAPVAPAGWHLSVDSNLLHVADVARRTVSILDGL